MSWVAVPRNIKSGWTTYQFSTILRLIEYACDRIYRKWFHCFKTSLSAIDIPLQTKSLSVQSRLMPSIWKVEIFRKRGVWYVHKRVIHALKILYQLIFLQKSTKIVFYRVSFLTIFFLLKSTYISTLLRIL